MAVDEKARAGEPGRIDQRGMAQAVHDDGVSLADQGSDDAEIGHITCREEKRGLAAREGRQRPL